MWIEPGQTCEWGTSFPSSRWKGGNAQLPAVPACSTGAWRSLVPAEQCGKQRPGRQSACPPYPRPQDEYFPADLLFLGAENEDGLCYIETMQLDGETNLKIKKALDETRALTEESLRGFAVRAPCVSWDREACGQHAFRLHCGAAGSFPAVKSLPSNPPTQATVRCEPPNSRLYHFTGNLELPQPGGAPLTVVSVPPVSVLLRGCSLRNTHLVYGLVLYAGKRSPGDTGSAGVPGPTGANGGPFVERNPQHNLPTPKTIRTASQATTPRFSRTPRSRPPSAPAWSALWTPSSSSCLRSSLRCAWWAAPCLRRGR